MATSTLWSWKHHKYELRLKHNGFNGWGLKSNPFIVFWDKGQTSLYIHMVYIYTQLVSCTVMFKSDRWRHRWIPWEHFVILWWQLLIAHLACLFKNWEKCNYHNFVENMNSIHWERNVSSDKNILEQWGLFKYWRIPSNCKSTILVTY